MNTPTARARNLALDGQAPDWIELLPAGPAITGADGRAWTLPDPQALVAAFAQRHAALVVDWEHASEHRAPHGLDAPAAGWIDQLAVRDGAVWGRVTWTEKAAAQIAAREYRYLSPVFSYQKADQRIVQLLSVGLTNQPNLPLTALNAETPAMDDSLLEQLRYLFNLPTLATVADIRAQLEQLIAQLDAQTATAGQRLSLSEYLTAVNTKAETPPLDRFVPRADYDAALARASNAEQQLATLATERRAATIQTLLDRALTERKIAPATVDYYRAMCQTEDGIAQFEAFLAKAPALIGAASGLDQQPPPAADSPEAGFAANAALRAEFGDFETYRAFQAAATSGRATILGSKAQ